MAEEHHSGPLEMGAEMDYAEHEKTYNFFIEFTKYATLVVVAILIAMAFGFFTSAGFISSFILFVLICGLGAYFLR
jgi:hypothetical protein